MKKKIKVGIAVAVAAVVIVSCSVARFGKKEVQEVAAIPVVTVTNPEVRTIELSSELIGTVEPDNIVYVMPKAGGEVTNVLVKTGDHVEAGDLLCTIDTKQVESTRLAMEAARVSMNTAQDTLNRMQILYASGDISEQDFTQTRNSAEAARLQFESAQEGYRIQTENANITAPISGRIENFGIELHDSLGTSDQICVISGEGGKAVTFYVSERVVKGVRQGDLLTVEKNGSTYPASVTEVSTMVDASTGLFKVKASVEDDGTLATGSSVKLSVVSERAEGVLTIPVDSVYYEQGNPFVYTYENGTVHKVSVETGLYDSESMEIQEGLNAEDQVIKSWTSELYEGSKVRLAEDLQDPEGLEDPEGLQNLEGLQDSQDQEDSQTPQTLGNLDIPDGSDSPDTPDDQDESTAPSGEPVAVLDKAAAANQPGNETTNQTKPGNQ